MYMTMLSFKTIRFFMTFTKPRMKGLWVLWQSILEHEVIYIEANTDVVPLNSIDESFRGLYEEAAESGVRRYSQGVLCTNGSYRTNGPDSFGLADPVDYDSRI
jgi:hypothetical protein